MIAVSLPKGRLLVAILSVKRSRFVPMEEVW